MLFTPYRSRLVRLFDNFGANPSANPGTSVVPGASNAEGTYTALATSGNVSQDVYGIYIKVADGSTSAAAKNHLLDLGVDPAGGSSYIAIISNLVCGASAGTTTPGGKWFYFPIFIKAGSSIACRIQGSNATAGTVRVSIALYSSPSRPEVLGVGTFSETIGTITNSNGVSFTPGNAADGAWVSLGTTTNPLWWWQVGYQIDNGTVTAEYTYIELAYGDATNKHTILKLMHAGTTTETQGDVMPTQLFEGYCPVPAGATIYIRGRCLNAPDTGYNAVAVGIGG
jgi:hypothetical protein